MENKKYFQKRLNDISKLKNGMNSDTPVIHQDIIDITQKLLNELSDEELENWSIAPFINGTIVLSYEHEDKNIVISIAQNEMTYTFYYITDHIGESGQHTFNTGNSHIDDGYSKMKYLIQNAKHYIID